MSTRLTHDFSIGGIPRVLKQQPTELSNDLGSDLAVIPTGDTNNNTSLPFVLAQDIMPGETVILYCGSRAGTPIGVINVTGMPADVTIEALNTFQSSNSVTASMVRIYFPTGAPTGQAGVAVFDVQTSKKGCVGWRYRGLANRPAVAWATGTATNATGTSGTTQAIPASWLPAVHAGCFTWGGSLVPQTARSIGDDEGTLDQIANINVGASAIVNFLAQHRKVIQAPKPNGMTMTGISNFSSTFVGIQAVWSTVPLVVATQSPRLFVPGRSANRRVGPPILLTQKFDAGASTVANQQVDAPVATATASAPIPNIDVSVGVPVATANASAPVPVPQLKVSPAAATASASAPTPAVQISLTVPVATASANGPPPVLPIAAPAATASASAPLPTMPIKVAGNTIILGYSNQSFVNEDIPTLERGMGRKFSGLRQNQQITVTSWSFANSDFDSGHAPATYRSIQLSTGLYTDITSGTWDTNLTAIANNLIASGRWSPARPAIITFMHEVALSSNDFLGTAQDYINAFRYVRNLFDSLGATVRSADGRYLGGPAIFAYVGWNRMFTNGAVDSPPAGKSYLDYDPDQGSSPAPAGTTYYTLVGSDPYNQIVSGSLKYGTDAATLLDDIKAQAVARGKDWMIGEMGVEDGVTAQSHLDKAAWIDSVRAYLSAITPTNSSGVCRYLFSTQEDGNGYNWDSSLDALAAGRRLALDPYFVQNSATAFAPAPDVFVFPIQVSKQSGRPLLGGSAARHFGPPVLLEQQSPDFTQAGALVSAPVATASASAPIPTIQVQVPPPAATAAASAPAPTLPVSAPTATANASAPVPGIDVRVLSPAATANASAPTPTVQLQIPVPVATANASAPTPGVDVKVSPAAATASASSPAPVPQLVIPVPVATASASAPAPTAAAVLEVGIQSGRPRLGRRGRAAYGPPVLLEQGFPDYTSATLSAPTATATASAPTPTIQLSVPALVATANASAPTPVPGAQVLAPAATASASSLVPTPQLRVSPAAATASASAPTPVPQLRILPGAATASASAIVPGVGAGNQTINPPVATANASAKVPTVTVIVKVSAPVATANASAPTPNVIMPQWPPDSGLQWPEHDSLQWPPGSSQGWGSSSSLQWPPDSDEQW